ncbi:MAG: nucleotidyltransferase family protein [Candidatus Paceibacterota bacterium]|jgi:mannose-1-phosphate guanylyltransferase/phosphomannomutase
MNSNNKISQAVILSAGLGTRLRPLTEGIPKVMVPLLGKPLLLHHIEQLKKHGIIDIFINLHYLPDVITDYFGDGSKFGVHITYAIEKPNILGTAGGVKNFEEKLKDNFFVIYGDVFSQVDYAKMAEDFFKKKNPIAMEIVGETNHPTDSDLVEIDSKGRFIKIFLKPHIKLPTKYYSMRALFIFNKKVLIFIPKEKYSEIDHEILPRILEAGGIIYGYKTKDFLKDIGTLDRYNEVVKYL